MPLHRYPRLTLSEAAILHVLERRPKQVVEYMTLARVLYGISADDGDIRLVQAFVRTLRNKIEPDTRSPRFIINRPGQGYEYHPMGYIPTGLSELMAHDTDLILEIADATPNYALTAGDAAEG